MYEVEAQTLWLLDLVRVGETVPDREKLLEGVALTELVELAEEQLESDADAEAEAELENERVAFGEPVVLLVIVGVRVIQAVWEVLGVMDGDFEFLVDTEPVRETEGEPDKLRRGDKDLEGDVVTETVIERLALGHPLLLPVVLTLELRLLEKVGLRVGETEGVWLGEVDAEAEPLTERVMLALVDVEVETDVE